MQPRGAGHLEPGGLGVRGGGGGGGEVRGEAQPGVEEELPRHTAQQRLVNLEVDNTCYLLVTANSTMRVKKVRYYTACHLLLPLGGAVGPQLLRDPEQQRVQVLPAAVPHEHPAQALHEPRPLQVVPGNRMVSGR